MSAVATKLSGVATQFKVGAAAVSIAAAASLTPVIANAEPINVPMPSAPAVTQVMGGIALGPAGFALAPADTDVDAAAAVDEFTPLGWIIQDIQNTAWTVGNAVNGALNFVGTSIQNSLLTVNNAIRGTFYTLQNAAGNINITGCIFGNTVHIGPYGSVSTHSGC